MNMDSRMFLPVAFAYTNPVNMIIGSAQLATARILVAKFLEKSCMCAPAKSHKVVQFMRVCI